MTCHLFWFPNDFMLSTPLLPSSASGGAAILARALPHSVRFSLFAQDAHWQFVTRALFGVLHPLFGDLYDLATGYADAVIERMRSSAMYRPHTHTHAASKIVALPIDTNAGIFGRGSVRTPCTQSASDHCCCEQWIRSKTLIRVLGKVQDWQGTTRKNKSGRFQQRGLKRAVALVHFAIAALPISAFSDRRASRRRRRSLTNVSMLFGWALVVKRPLLLRIDRARVANAARLTTIWAASWFQCVLLLGPQSVPAPCALGMPTDRAGQSTQTRLGVTRRGSAVGYR